MPDGSNARRKGTWTAALLAGGGVACLVAAFSGHVRFGALLVRIAAPLIVYGCLMLSRSLRPPSMQVAGRDAAPFRSAAQLLPLLTSRRQSAQALGLGPWTRFCLVVGRLGLAVLLLCFASLVVTIALFLWQRSVVLTGVPSLVSGPAVIVAAVFSLLVGVSWSVLAGRANPAIVALRGLTLGLFVTMPMLLVPLFITGEQLAQAAVFSGPTVVSSRLYRVGSAEERHGKGGVRFEATVDPFHCVSCIAPTLPIDESAYRKIEASGINVPFGPDFAGWPARRSTSLCVREVVERAGMAERILLKGDPTASDLSPCPPGFPG